MINAKIDDKKCVVTLKGIENNANLIGALFEPEENYIFSYTSK